RLVRHDAADRRRVGRPTLGLTMRRFLCAPTVHAEVASPVHTDWWCRALSIGIPRGYGGHGGPREMFEVASALAESSFAAACVYAAERHFIEVLVNATNVGLREYRLPSLLDGSISGTCGATWPLSTQQPLAGSSSSRGWRLNGEIPTLPNVGV